MSQDHERSLQRRPNSTPASREGELRQTASLSEMMQRVVTEFEQLPPVRDENDYPDSFAYLLNREQGALVMLRRRRPEPDPVNGRIFTNHTHGYFAEIFAVDYDGVQPGITGEQLAPALNGQYERIEVTDEETDPYNRAGLTPTRFDTTRARRLINRINNQLALPSPEADTTAVLGQLFANKQQAESRQVQQRAEELSLREEITGRFFSPNARQGISPQVGYDFFVFSADGEQSPHVQVLKSLGVNASLIEPGVDARWQTGSSTILKELKDSQGKLPFVLILDSLSFARKSHEFLPGIELTIRNMLLGHAEDTPVFALVDVLNNEYQNPSVTRLQQGKYDVVGEDPEMLKGLYTKIGVDRLLTETLRDLVKNIQ